MNSQPNLKRARHQISESSSFPTRPWSPIQRYKLQGSPAAEDHALLCTGEELSKRRQVTSVDALPDETLLVIFDHYLYGVRLKEKRKSAEKAWQSLVHVCRQWRRIVFQSPRRLDLWLVCTRKTPVRDRLYVWPALPLIILDESDSSKVSTRSMGFLDNILAALERPDRVCQINVGKISRSDMEIGFAAMQQPFPELTYLQLEFCSNYETQVFPDFFLRGSAPRLEVLTLFHFPFPDLPKLLLSSTRLRILNLHIPHSGYFPPDAIVTALSTLTSLDFLELKFLSPRSCPDQASRCPPPLTHFVLPVLTGFDFKGVSEYLEDLVACIDAPKLNRLRITFYSDVIFDAPQLIQFMSRTPKLKALIDANISFTANAVKISFFADTFGGLVVEILCKGLYWQLSSLEQVCSSCLPPPSMLDRLYVYDGEGMEEHWKDNIDDDEAWMNLLRPFSAVTNLFLYKKVSSHVAPALQGLVEGRTTEVLPTVLPTVQKIYVRDLQSKGPVQKKIEQFVAARRVAGHSIAVCDWFHGSICVVRRRSLF